MKDKIYYEKHREQIKENVKLWTQENPDKRKKNVDNYYKNHHESINANVKCECGTEFSRSHIRRHERSKKHIAYMETKAQEQI